MLSGQDGILTKAKIAKDKFDAGSEKDFSALTQLEMIEIIPSGAEVIQGDSSKGIVIKDSNDNQWVWIEVPKEIYTNTKYNGGVAPTSSEDYAKIESVMKNYSSKYKVGNYFDKWCDTYWATYNETYNCGNLPYVPNSDYEKLKEHYGAVYSDTKLSKEVVELTYGGNYYVKMTEDMLNDTNGCGLTYEEYNNYYKSMLKSIYKNGGFWIGRYEAGTDTPRNSTEDELTDAVIQRDKYPYNCIYSNVAQTLAESLATGNKTSSLMFGIQWDLTMKFIEEKGYLSDGKTKITQDMIKTDSTEWGNYTNAIFKVERGKINTSKGWQDFDVNYEDKYIDSLKNTGYAFILTTGACDRNSTLNIYDIAGNLYEFTLAQTRYRQRVSGGGSYSSKGNDCPAADRGNYGGTRNLMFGFRPAMW